MHAARRVVRTESNYCTNQAELKGMKDAGFDEYEFISLGEEADNVCRVCDDLDGQRFKIADAVVGVNCPPMHPFCRCKVTTPCGTGRSEEVFQSAAGSGTKKLRETEEDIQREIDERIDSWNIPEGMSLDELVDRVNNGELEEIRKEQDSALKSAETLDKSTESGIISRKVSDRITHFYDKNGEAYSDEEIEKALMSSPIGADSAKFIEDNGYNLEFYYNTESNGLAGDVYGKHIEIYPDEHIDAKDIASTIVHEVSHEKYNWKGTQENEINCYLMERFFKLGDVSERDIKECVLLVKEKYPELPRGDLYGYDS